MRILNNIRMAGAEIGKRFLDFDEKYAKMADRESMPASSQLMHGMPLRTAANYVQNTNAGQQLEQNAYTNALRYGTNAGMVTANAASRYALPAGGLTLAGVGLYDLATGGSEREERDADRRPYG